MSCPFLTNSTIRRLVSWNVCSSMKLLRCLPLICFLTGTFCTSLNEDYQYEEWQTRYAPKECEKPPLRPLSLPGTLKRWFYNLSRTTCEPFLTSVQEPQENCFESKEACNKNCRDPHYGVCADPKNDRLCKQKTEQRFWFNPDTKRCERYRYGGCSGNTNNFRTPRDCLLDCGEFIDDACRLPIEVGDCFTKEVRFGYNPSFEACEAFNYTGCGGNRNNFLTAYQCLTACARKHVPERKYYLP
uniref:BPTI/Kunitz inhibitor domain-containing protein n=1 Tax=Amblyomma maculatum TaxID=34609 RepID=G3MNI9_AMBMU